MVSKKCIPIKVDAISSVLFLLVCVPLVELGLPKKPPEDKAMDVIDRTPVSHFPKVEYDCDATVLLSTYLELTKSLNELNWPQAQLIKMRGFIAEEHSVVTEDGYILHVVRIINPLAQRSHLKRPVLFNHGLLESSTIWLINSKSVKPMGYPPINADFQPSNNSMINAPMMLSNQGYDVWLLSMRGTDFSLGHMNETVNDSAFWDFCLDDFALKDIPSTVDYIRSVTGSEKVGYVGHSQATFSIFALLSTRTEYADIVEPIAAFAPVAFMHHTTSLARPVFKLAADLPIIDKLNIPSPLFCPQLRMGLKGACDNSKFAILKSFCMAEELLIAGLGQNFVSCCKRYV